MKYRKYIITASVILILILIVFLYFLTAVHSRQENEITANKYLSEKYGELDYEITEIEYYGYLFGGGPMRSDHLLGTAQVNICCHDIKDDFDFCIERSLSQLRKSDPLLDNYVSSYFNSRLCKLLSRDIIVPENMEFAVTGEKNHIEESSVNLLFFRNLSNEDISDLYKKLKNSSGDYIDFKGRTLLKDDFPTLMFRVQIKGNDETAQNLKRQFLQNAGNLINYRMEITFVINGEYSHETI